MVGGGLLRAGFILAMIMGKSATEASDDIVELRAHAMSSDDDPAHMTSVLRDARQLQMSGVTSADLPSAYATGGQLVTGSRDSYIGGDGTLDYTALDFANPNNLVINNLGGMGPNFSQRCETLRDAQRAC